LSQADRCEPLGDASHGTSQERSLSGRFLLRGRTASANPAHCVEHSGPTRFPSAGDDVALGALHDGKQLFVLRLRHIEFRHRVVEILAEGGPLTLGEPEVFMRFDHGTEWVALGTTCSATAAEVSY